MKQGGHCAANTCRIEDYSHEETNGYAGFAGHAAAPGSLTCYRCPAHAFSHLVRIIVVNRGDVKQFTPGQRDGIHVFFFFFVNSGFVIRYTCEGRKE